MLNVSHCFWPSLSYIFTFTHRNFYEEHIHTDEEIRYVVDGSGYFDVRDKEDRWIRIATKKGDMIVLPAGIYHRYEMPRYSY